MRLLPVPKAAAITRTYRVGEQAEILARRWAQALPAAQVTAADGAIRVEGLLEDHELIEARFRAAPTRRTTTTAGKEVYQFAAENAALDQVVEQLATRLNLDVRWNREAIDQAGTAVDQLVTVRVKDVALDELLAAVFKGTGLTCKRDGRTVTISAAAKGDTP